MIDLTEKKDDIIKLLFWVNLAVALISIFFFSKSFILFMLAGNTILCGSFIILKKYGEFFNIMIMGNRIAKKLNTSLEKIYG